MKRSAPFPDKNRHTVKAYQNAVRSLASWLAEHHPRAAGGNERDLMLLGGWRSRAMLDRYGKAAAAERAADAYRRLSLGDRI